MKNGNSIIGLFKDMFEGNILTFNPGWDKDCNELKNFDDARELLKNFKANGIDISNEIIENKIGPASFTITDPDGNKILIDQHR